MTINWIIFMFTKNRLTFRFIFIFLFIVALSIIALPLYKSRTPLNKNRIDPSVEGKIYSSDWFSHHIELWDSYKPLFNNIPNIKCLEVGSFEGRSTNYIAKNFCNGKDSYIDSVDMWTGYNYVGYDGNMDKDSPVLFDRFIHNTKKYLDEGRLIYHRNLSSITLTKFLYETQNNNREKYDFIYIDGSHLAKDVLLDTILAWQLLKTGGIMFFDDYELSIFPNNPEMDPKPAIDGFLNSYKGYYEILHKDWQIHIRKIKE